MFSCESISADNGVDRSGRHRPGQFVGRIGALALFLGVGGVIGGLPAVATADTGTGRDTGSAGAEQQASSPSDSADSTSAAAPRRHTAKRGGFADRAANASPAASADSSDAGPVRGSTTLGKRSPQRSAVADSALAGSALEVRADIVVPDGSGQPVSTVPADINPVVASVVTAPSLSAAPPAAAVAAKSPVMAAASTRGSVSSLNSALLAFLGGGAGPDAPVTEPMAWAAVAVSRRQTFAAASVAAPAASISDFLNLFNGGQTLLDQLASSLTGQVSQFIQTNLKDIAPIADKLAPIVVNGVADWIFNGTVAPELNQLANDPEILSFVAGWAAKGLADFGLPPEVNAAVGNAAASLVQNVFGGAANADVRAAIDNFLNTLPGLPAGNVQLVTDLLSGKVNFGSLISDQVDAALANLPTLLGDPAIQQALGGALTSAVGILTGGELPQWATDLDPAAVVNFVSSQITQWVTPQLGADLAGAIGDAAAGLLPALADGVGTVAGAALTTFFNQPGVSDALSGAVSQLANAVLGGADPFTALLGTWSSLQSNSALTAALDATLSATLDALDSALLSNPAVTGALGSAVTTLITGLTNDPAAWAMVTDVVNQLAAGTNFAGLVSGLLNDPEIGASLAKVVGTTITAFLNQSGVSAAVTDIAGQFANALLGGADPYAALQNALGALQSDPAIQAAVSAALAGILQSIGDNGVAESLSGTVATLVTKLVTDPVVQEAITTQIGGPLGGIIVDVLGPIAANLEEVLTPAITALLNAPGVGTALTDVVGQVLNGADPATALQGLLDSVQSDPEFQASLGTALSDTINTVLDNGEIRDALGGAAGAGVATLLADAGVNFAPLTNAVNKVTDTAVAALLASPLVGNLVSGVAVDILGGLPLADLPAKVLGTVLQSTGLQDAVGFALGKGIGSLFGDNFIGAALGTVAGLQAAAVIRLVSFVVVLTNPAVAAAASVSPNKNSSPALASWWLPAAAV